MSKTLLTDEIIKEKLDMDGIMEEPDGPWLLEYINEKYSGSLDNTTDWNDSRHMLKIYSESTADSYDIYWCTHNERPYVSEDGYQYEDYAEWSNIRAEISGMRPMQGQELKLSKVLISK